MEDLPRRFGDYAPDNSLVGAKLAIDNHMDGVDMDAQLSSDGTIVIFHDLSVDRLTVGTGKVQSKTRSELQSLDLATKYGQGFKNAYVATFEDFVEAFSEKTILMVELKVPGTASTGIEQKAIDIIKKNNAYDRVYLSSFNPIVLWRLKHLDPKIHTVLIFMDTNWNPQLLAEIKKEDLVNLPWFIRQEWIRRAIRKVVKPDALSVNNEVQESTINALISRGYPVFLWTVETKDRIQWALEKHPYGIITDEPQLGKELRDSAH